MKKLSLIIISALLLSTIACDQMGQAGKTKNEVKKPDTSLEDSLLKKALIREDYATLFVAINTILIKDSTRVGLKDTLFSLYLQNQNVSGLVDLGEEILKDEPNKTEILEGTASAYEYVGMFNKSIPLWERLYAIVGDPRIKLQLATNYAGVGDFESAKKSANDILNSDAPGLDTMYIAQQTLDNSGRSQKVKVMAMAHYALGVIYRKEGKKQQAIAEAQKALKISPYFDLAAKLLSELKYGKK